MLLIIKKKEKKFHQYASFLLLPILFLGYANYINSQTIDLFAGQPGSGGYAGDGGYALQQN